MLEESRSTAGRTTSATGENGTYSACRSHRYQELTAEIRRATVTAGTPAASNDLTQASTCERDTPPASRPGRPTRCGSARSCAHQSSHSPMSRR